MHRFRQTAEILRLMHKKECIRNIGVIAHIDHGKTTMTDSLLAEAGLISPKIAGEARVLDYLEEEQKRGITIKTANISLLHEVDGRPYVINLVDTPGHVDFTGKVTRALRAIDGAVVVVDAVEEVMAQTETVTRQALEERVRPVLFINKVDRLIRELRLTPNEIQGKLERIVRDFNNLIEIYGEPEFKEQWKVSPQNETVAFGSALHKWGFTLKIAQEKGLKIKEVIEAYAEGNYQSLERLIPLHNAIMDMVVNNIPSPAEAQKYRLPKIWKGDINSEVGRAMLNCNDDGPTVMCITMVQMDPKEGPVATGRLFSGSVKPEDHVYLVGAKKDCIIKHVFMYMGVFRENVEKISAGNITAVSGLEGVWAGETLVDASYRKAMAPFERIRYVSEPVVTIAVEPRNPEDLPILLEAMNRVSVEDPNLVVTVNKETGEYLLSGLGELHLEIALKALKDYSGVEIVTPKPMVVYRESVSEKGAVASAESPDGHSRFWVQTEPLEEKALALIEKGVISSEMDTKLAGEILFKEAGLQAEEAEKVLAIDEYKNILINLVEEIQQFHEAREAIIAGFHWACRAGPLCEEPLRGVKIKLVKAQNYEGLAYKGLAQIAPTIRRAIIGSLLTAKPVLLEPVYKIVVSVPAQRVGECTGLILRHRGKIFSFEQKGALTIITGYIPVAETFGLASEMRSATSGYAFWQCSFERWERVPADVSANVIIQVRKRKGLHPEMPTLGKFVD
ncbi:MAG: elongation factor EF-2 [Nitrososphaerota archaeon]|nr:elongation factor EF-2 [Candidatus Bathyarchaeota archaeon]MDW8022772.1 elongation factor EF-2 [Nitrososphaerota archaeon]